VYDLQTRADTCFEDAGDGFARASNDGFFFQKRDEWVLRIACYEEAVVTFEIFAEGGEAVFYGFGGVVFIVYALGA
jgi:hypothetical protein